MNKGNWKKRINEILSKPYARRLIPDESGGYTASIQEFPGCFAEGETLQEAIENLDKAAKSWVKVALLNGYKIKEPTEYMKCNRRDEPQPPKYTWEVDSIMHMNGYTSYKYYWRKDK